MSFAKYVSYETVHKATFNYYEPSYPIDKDGRRFTVFHTKYPRPEMNLVVIQADEDMEELYFRAFPGKHSGECETEKETENFFNEVRSSIDDEFRVKGKDLEKRILQTLKELKTK